MTWYMVLAGGLTMVALIAMYKALLSNKDDERQSISGVCLSCHGKGRVSTQICPNCNGTGSV